MLPNLEKIPSSFIQDNGFKGRKLKTDKYGFTISKCKEQYWSKEYILQELGKREDISNYCISEEQHQDGTPHYHGYIELRNRKIITGDRLDYLKHANMIFKPGTQWLSYVSKYSSVLTSINLRKVLIESPKTWAKEVIKRLDQGISIKAIIEQNKLMAFNKGSKITSFISLLERADEEAITEEEVKNYSRLNTLKSIPISKEPYKTYTYDGTTDTRTECQAILNDQEIKILTKLNEMLKFKWSRPKICQKELSDDHPYLKALLLVSPPSYGKTSLINLFEAYFPSYLYPTDNWFRLYKNYTYYFINWNEPKISRSNLEFIKQLLEGLRSVLNVKNKRSSKNDNPLTIITSNNSLKKLVTDCREYMIQSDCTRQGLDYIDTCSSCKRTQQLREKGKATTYNCKSPVRELNQDGEAAYNQLYKRIYEIELRRPLFFLIDYIKQQFKNHINTENPST